MAGSAGAMFGLLGGVFAALIASGGAVLAAMQSRRAAERTVEVQLSELMQRETELLHHRVSSLRKELTDAHDAADSWRERTRRLQSQVEEMEHLMALNKVITPTTTQHNEKEDSPP